MESLGIKVGKLLEVKHFTIFCILDNQLSGLSASICEEISSDEELAEAETNINQNYFCDRRKSCYSWRLRQNKEAAAGVRNTHSRASADSAVFEMIHLDESNEEVSKKDKLITGKHGKIL